MRVLVSAVLWMCGYPALAATAATEDARFAWPANASWQYFYRTSTAETYKLLADPDDHDVRERSPLGYVGQSHCPIVPEDGSKVGYDPGQKGFPCLPALYHRPLSFVVASRHITSFQEGDTIDASGNAQVTAPDYIHHIHDAVFGRLILADSPTATSGIAISAAKGGTIDERGDRASVQHHFLLTAAGKHRAGRGDAAVRWASANTLYVNFVVTTHNDDKPGAAKDYFSKNPGTVDVDTFYTQLTAQIFRPARPGQALMAIDTMTSSSSNPVKTLALPKAAYPKNLAPVWVSPPIRDLRYGQVIKAHADLALSVRGDCTPNIYSQVVLTRDPSLRSYGHGHDTIAMSQQAGTNLTPDHRSNTLSPYGSVMLSPVKVPSAGGLAVSDISGTWHVVVIAATDTCSVTLAGGKSKASASRFRAAAAGSGR